MTYPVNQFPQDLIYNLGKAYAAFICVCKDQHINNDIAERFFAEAVGATYRKTTALADVRLGGSGWSIKTRYVHDPILEDRVSIKLTTRFLTKQVSKDNADEIGSAFLENWNQLVSETKAEIPDMRTLILLHERKHEVFSLVESETKSWNPEDFYWGWSGTSSIHGFSKETGNKQFAVHLNDSRLYVEEKIYNRLTFILKVPEFNRERLLEQIEFSDKNINILSQVDSQMTVSQPKKNKSKRFSNANLDALFDGLVA